MSLFDLVTLRAFRPHPKNIKIPLALKLPGERVLIFGVGTGQVRVGTFLVPQKTGGLAPIEHSQTFQRRDGAPFSDFVEAVVKKTEYAKAKYAVVVLQHSWKLYLRNGYFEKNELNLKLRQDASSVINETSASVDGHGDVYESINTYAGLANPNAERVLLFSAPTIEIENIHDAIQSAGLEVVGFKIGALAALENYYSETVDTPQDPSDVLYVDRFSYCFVGHSGAERNGVPIWTDVRYATKRSDEVIERMADAVRERAEPDRPIILLAADQRAEEVRKLFPKVAIKPAFGVENFDVFSVCTT